ncbi:polysaccharide deacetylase family protein [Pseudoclavibacter sp. RFBA6]|uniref:polysaccharide deacetylase family protein n=1 Tax=Pseudoclavibacter sp. RFBA6 TaxID=2080573 RepID=UPI000CE8F065|nr:polysaccharide deacetylase family protein [Pseudoclavibacter sp. RFBA6]PPG42218.1 hypothetical protein C5C17_04510 [Pseudoclavibacter sp. RFBA6]
MTDASRQRSKRRPVRRLLGVAMLGVATFALAACTPAPDLAWQPPVRAAVTSFDEAVGDVAGAEPGSTPLDHHRIRDSAPAVDARWTEVPGQTDLNARVRSLVVDAVGAFASRLGTTYEPEAAAAGAGLGSRGCEGGSSSTLAAEVLAQGGATEGEALVITCEIVVASGSEFGERVRVVEGTVGATPAVTRDESFVFFADTATAQQAGGADVITADAALSIWNELVLAARRELGALWDTQVAPPSEANAAVLAKGFADVTPTPDGGLRIGIPAGLLTPEMDVSGGADAAPPISPDGETTLVVGEPISHRFPSIHIAADAAAPMLTDLGRELVAASATPQPLLAGERPLAGERDVNCELFACVALTFDDGPAPITETLLGQLRDHDATATFFLVGPNVQRYPEIARQIDDDGHQLGNHSWSHPQFTTLDDKKIEEEVKKTNDAILAATGERPSVFRPPYGDVDARVLTKVGMPSILWDIDTLDWEGPPHETIVDRGANEAEAGSIILMHDIHDSTVDAVPEILTGLHDRGFVLVTIDQIFGGAPAAGNSYTSAR